MTPAHRPAFTLMELLVVVSILAVLAGLLIPAIASVKRMAHRTAAINGIKQLGLSVSAYAMDEDGRLPGPLVTGNDITYWRGMSNLGLYLHTYFEEPAPPVAPATGQLRTLRDRARESAGFKTQFVRNERYYPQGRRIGTPIDPCGSPGRGTYPIPLNSINQPSENIFLQDSSLENYAPGTDIPAKAFHGRYVTLYYDGHVETMVQRFQAFYYGSY